MWLGPRPLVCVRRCPTLPHPPGCSTIGAVGLSFRVRNGTGRFPHAMTAVTLVPVPPLLWGVGRLVVTTSLPFWGQVVVLFNCWFLAVQPGGWGLLVGNHIVDASRMCFCVV